MKQFDITAEGPIEIEVRDDSKVVWINQNGICIVRISQIKELIINDRRIKKMVKQLSREMNRK